MRRAVQFVLVSGGVGCVYFQAAAASSLLASTLLPPLPTEPRVDPVRKRPEPRRSPLTPGPLYANNPFDWRVNLNPTPETSSDEPATPSAEATHVDPLLAEVCTSVSVSIVTEAVDPRESLTVLQGPDDQRPIQRRVGDQLGDYEVAYIGFNRTKASPAVWLTSSTGLCQTLLFSPTPVEHTKAAEPEVADKATKPESKPNKAALAPELAQRISKLSDTHVKVERSVVDQVLANPSVFMGSARIVPAKNGAGQASEVRLFGVRDDTLLGALNLKNGDAITSVNGFNLSSPEQALSAYARLRSAQNLSVEVTRQGKPVTLEISIE
jgi:general secretion pathway protein C